MVWIGGSQGIKSCIGFLRWCWNPSRCWILKVVRFWVDMFYLGAAMGGEHQSFDQQRCSDVVSLAAAAFLSNLSPC